MEGRFRMPREITAATSLENLRKEAKRWLKALRAGEGEALARFRHAHSKVPERPVLRDVQYALAREYGLAGWAALKQAIGARRGADGRPLAARTVEEFERLASDIVLALDSRDDEALRRMNACYRRSFSHDDLWAEVWRRVYAFRQRSSR